MQYPRTIFILNLLFLSICIIANAQEVPVFEWTRAVGSTGTDRGNGIATDAAGNVYSVGVFTGTVDFDPGPGVFNLTGLGSFDIYISKLNSSGNFLWAKAVTSTGTDSPSSTLVVDASGNIYVTGSFSNTADFDTGAGVYNLTSAGAEDIFVLKLDTDGNLIWAKSLGGADRDFGQSIAVDASGNVYTTGQHWWTADFDPGPGVFNITPTPGYGIFVSKLDVDGNFVWAKSISGGSAPSSGDSGRAIKCDASGNLYITGVFSGTRDFNPGAGVFNLTATDADLFILKLDQDGNFVWAKSFGSTFSDSGNSLVLDADANIYVGGNISSTVDFDPGPGVFNIEYGIFVSKFDTDGNLIWAKSTKSNPYMYAFGLTIDASRNVYSVGEFSGTADLDPDPAEILTATANNYDLYIIKLDVDGDLVWATTAGGSSRDQLMAATIDASGYLYTTGYFQTTTDFDPGACIYNLTSAGMADAFVRKLSMGTAGAAPTITSFTPDTGPIGTTVTLTGTNFSSTPGNNAVTFYNNRAATVTASTPTSITTTVPALSTTGKISVVVNCITVQSATNFTVGAALLPTITSFTPTTGLVGTTVTITGTNLSATPANNLVAFNGIAAVVTASTPTSITTSVPAGATTGKITVTVSGNMATSAADFTVTVPLPTITSFTPLSGLVATTVSITGTNFSATPANNSVAFNGTAAVVTASTPTSITTSVPAGATTGKITVTVAGNTATSATDFVVSTTTNQPPIISPTTTSVPINGIVMVDLISLLSDPDQNLDLATLTLLTNTSEQGATATILPSLELELNYGGVAFAGTDRVSIEVCDFMDACTQQELSIEVGGDVTVYNAISPNNDGKNDTFVIQYIDLIPDTQNNQVTIYSRWGDVVFEISNYNNDDRAFTGLNKNGKELPSGTYFYKIEFSGGRKMKSGYLSLKR